MHIMLLKVENKRMFPLNSNIEEPFPLLYSLKPSDGTQKSVVLSITSLNNDQAKYHTKRFL